MISLRYFGHGGGRNGKFCEGVWRDSCGDERKRDGRGNVRTAGRGIVRNGRGKIRKGLEGKG